MTLPEILAKINPGFEKTTIYRIMEYIVLAGLLYGLYADVTESLHMKSQGSAETLKGQMVQIGATRQLTADLEKEVNSLREWNKALSARVNRLEDVAIRRGH